MNKNKIYACMSKLAIATMIATSLASTVYAANGDLWMNNEKKGTTMDVVKSSQKRMHLIQNRNDYTYELDGKLYKVMEVDGVFKQNSDTDQNTVYDIIKANLQEVGAIPTEDKELKVESVSAINAKKLEVKFSQEVNKTEAEKINVTPANSNYEVVGVDLTSATAELQDDNKTVIITLDDSKKIANDKTFVVTVKPIASKADANVKTALYTKTITFSDTVKPTLVDVKYPQSGIAVLNFSEELQALSNGNVKSFDGDKEVNLTPVLTDDAKGIKLTGLEANKEYKVVVLGVKDMSSNLITPNPIEVTVKSTVKDEIKPEVVSIESVGLDTLKVKFSEPLQNLKDGSTVTNDKYLDVTGAKVSTDQVFDAKTNTVTVTLNEVTGGGVKAIKVSGYKDLAGNVGEDFTKNVVFAAVVPTVEKTEVVKEGTDTFVKLTFNTDMTAATLTSVNITGTVTTPENILKDITIAADGNFEVDSTDAKIATIKVTGKEAGKYSLAIPKEAFTPELAKDLKVIFELDEAVDTTVPVATLGAVTNETVTVTFADANGTAIDMGQSALDVNNYTVSGQKVFEKAIFKDNKNTVELTLKDDAIKYDGDYEFAISTDVKAENGVALKEVFTETKAFKENVAPIVKKAELIGGDKIKVTFSEVIESYTAKPFEVYVGGEKVAIDDIVAKASGGDKDYIEITITDALKDLSKDIVVKFAEKAELKDGNGNVLVPEGSYTVTK